MVRHLRVGWHPPVTNRRKPSKIITLLSDSQIFEFSRLSFSLQLTYPSSTFFTPWTSGDLQNTSRKTIGWSSECELDLAPSDATFWVSFFIIFLLFISGYAFVSSEMILSYGVSQCWTVIPSGWEVWFGVIYSLSSHHLFALNVTEVFFVLFFLNVLQNKPSRLLYVVLDALPETGNFPDSGGFVQLFWSCTSGDVFRSYTRGSEDVPCL